MTADAAIGDVPALSRALDKAVAAAAEGYVVTFGMRPTRAETGYGYIEQGAELPGVPGAWTVSRFVEKPSAEVAATLVADSRYLWNSGMFIARARTFLEETRAHAPQVFDAVQQAVSRRVADLDFERLDPASFCAAPDISVDYAIAERTALAATVPGDFGWSDIGSWDALWELSPKDEDGNAVHGDVFLDDARNCYVRSEGILTTVCGVSDLVVVTTRDAVMISHRDRAQDVKKMVARLTHAGRQEATAHNRIYRPWGFYEGLIQGERFQVKRIVVQPGQKLSLQKHFHRAEHWVVVAVQRW